MSFLANAATHATRADALHGGAWELLANTEGTRFKLIYTSTDGSKNSHVFPSLEDASLYAVIIGSFWKCIVDAEQETEAVKAQTYGELWVLMGTKIHDHGKDFLPGDLKKLFNEIEEYLGMTVTVFD